MVWKSLSWTAVGLSSLSAACRSLSEAWYSPYAAMILARLSRSLSACRDDRAEATVAWVREVPSPARAAELLAEYGVRWEGELLSHSLSPVPEEAEGRR